MPKISVVMPAYNEERKIIGAIRSILSQSFKDFELLVINDCSTDSTKEKVLSVNDDRIVLIDNSFNLGVAASLNKGISVSKGQYIARMDADDISHPDRFQKQLEYLEKNAKIGLLGSWCYLVVGEGSVIREEIKLPVNHRDIVEYLKKDNSFIHSSVIFRKEVFDKCGPYKLEKGMEDYDLFLKIALNYEVLNLPYFLVTRYENNNIGTKKTYEGLNKYKIYKMRMFYQLKAIKQFGFSIRCIWYLARTIIKMFLSRLKLIFVNCK